MFSDDDETTRKLNRKVMGGFGGVVLLGILSVWIIRGHVAGHETTASAQAHSSPSDSAPPTPSPESIYEVPTPKLQNCYRMAKLMHVTSATRSQFVSESAEHAEALGDDVIHVTNAGEDNEILLYSAAPDHRGVVVKLAAVLHSSASSRRTYCQLGFTEVQFIVRDENEHQSLVAKWNTDADYVQMMRHAIQTTGAEPMQ